MCSRPLAAAKEPAEATKLVTLAREWSGGGVAGGQPAAAPIGYQGIIKTTAWEGGEAGAKEPAVGALTAAAGQLKTTAIVRRGAGRRRRWKRPLRLR